MVTACACNHEPREEAMVVIGPGVWCDPCIVDIVQALYNAGIQTVASCCGHCGQFDPAIPGANGSISLADGRELVIRPDQVRG